MQNENPPLPCHSDLQLCKAHRVTPFIIVTAEDTERQSYTHQDLQSLQKVVSANQSLQNLLQGGTCNGDSWQDGNLVAIAPLLRMFI